MKGNFHVRFLVGPERAHDLVHGRRCFSSASLVPPECLEYKAPGQRKTISEAFRRQFALRD